MDSQAGGSFVNLQSAPEAAPAAAPAAIPATAPVVKPRSLGLTFSLPAPLDKENLAAAAPFTTASHDKPGRGSSSRGSSRGRCGARSLARVSSFTKE